MAAESRQPCTYSADMARHYDGDYAAIGRTQDVPFYTGLAREAGGPVLEVGCGTSRVLLPVARAGVTVVGADPTPAMREILAAKLAREAADVRARVRLVDGQFADLPLQGPFALVYSPFRAFMHLYTRDEQRAGLAEMARVLGAGGRLAFDLFDFDPELAARAAQGQVDCHYVEDGVEVTRSSRASYDAEQRLVRATLSWTADGQPAGEPVDCELRVSSAGEITDLLREAGLVPEALYRDFERTPHDPGDPGELVFVARHP